MNVLYEIYFSVFRRIATSRGGGHTVRVTPGAQPAPERGGPDKGHPRHAIPASEPNSDLSRGHAMRWDMAHAMLSRLRSALASAVCVSRRPSRVSRLRLASAVSRQPDGKPRRADLGSASSCAARRSAVSSQSRQRHESLSLSVCRGAAIHLTAPLPPPQSHAHAHVWAAPSPPAPATHKSSAQLPMIRSAVELEETCLSPDLFGEPSREDE